MGQVVWAAVQRGLVFGAFAPLICGLEFLWNLQADSVSGTSGDGVLGVYGVIVGYGVVLVLAFLVLFVVGFVFGFRRRAERPVG
jgi:hypothetical protein